MKVTALNGLLTGSVPEGTRPEDYDADFRLDIKRFNAVELQRVTELLANGAINHRWFSLILLKLRATQADAEASGLTNRATIAEGAIRYLEGNGPVMPPGHYRYITAIHVDGADVGYFGIVRQEQIENTEKVTFVLKQNHEGETYSAIGSLRDGILTLLSEDITDQFGDPIVIRQPEESLVVDEQSAEVVQ